MYLIYGKEDGKVWREVHQFDVAPNGDIHAGINGVNTLTYPASVGVDVLEISPETWEAMDQEHLDRYIVNGGAIEEDPDWKEPEAEGASQP